MMFDQMEFNIRCEWGEHGVRQLAPHSDVIIIVDVMSFSTAVTIATSRDANVYPYQFKDDSRFEFAQAVNAELAGSRGKSKYSLSPVSLMAIPSGTRLVLPSPNGSSLTLLTGSTPTFAGCLRNSKAVAKAASHYGNIISVIPAGERWERDNSLRPALEDFIGAGAIIRYLQGSLSPEAKAAVACFQSTKDNLQSVLKQCSSGKQLIEMGFEKDIHPISELDVDDCAPVLKDDVFIKGELTR